MTQSARFCRSCGATVPQDSDLQFCGSCGQPLPPAEPPNPSPPPGQAHFNPGAPAAPPARRRSKPVFWVFGCLGVGIGGVVLLILGAVAYTLFSESAVRSRDSEAEASFRSMEGAWTLVEGDGTEHYTEEQKRFTLTVRPSDPSGLQRHPFELKGESTLGSFTLDDVDGGVMTGGLLTNDNYIPDDYGIYSIRAAPADDRRTLTMDLTYQVGDGTQKKRRFVFQKTAP